LNVQLDFRRSLVDVIPVMNIAVKGRNIIHFFWRSVGELMRPSVYCWRTESSMCVGVPARHWPARGRMGKCSGSPRFVGSAKAVFHLLVQFPGERQSTRMWRHVIQCAEHGKVLPTSVGIR